MSFSEFYNGFAGLGRAYRDQQDREDYKKWSEDAANLAGQQLGAFQAQQGTGGLSALGASPAVNLPSFAGGRAPMTLPTSASKENETKFVGALKDGGLTNPFGLAAAAAYANRESKYSPQNINGSWSDPSESGQAGTSGGILSWRGDRLANMKAFTQGAPDPVVAQAKFFLTEDPNTTFALQNAKSAEEANDILAKAWKFAGYNRPGGGEYAARLGTTRAYLGRLSGGQPTQVASAPLALPPGASGLNPGYRPPQAPATAPPVIIPPSMSSGTPAQTRPAVPAPVMPPSAIPAAGGVPENPQVASADEADLPAQNARPVGFQIPPGQQAQAQPDFVPGTVASPAIGSPSQGQLPAVSGQPRLTPQAAQFLRAQLANPLTRAQAIQTIQGLGAPQKVEVKELGGRVVRVGANGSVEAVAGFDKPVTYQTQKGADGNDYTFNPQTGQWTRAIQGKNEVFSDVTDPAERLAAGVPEGYKGAVQRGPDGKLYAPFKAATEVNIDQKGETAFSTTANTAIAKRFEKLSEEGDGARTDSALLGQLRGLGTVVGTGPMAAAQSYLADKGIKLGDNVGAVEAYGAIVDKMVPAQRIPGSGTTSDFDAKGFKSSLPNLMKTPEGNALIINTLDALNQDKMARARIAERALTGEIKPQDAVRELRALPPPNIAFKSGLAELARAGKLSGQGATDAGAGSQGAQSGQQAPQFRPLPPEVFNDAQRALNSNVPRDVVLKRLREQGYDASAIAR